MFDGNEGKVKTYGELRAAYNSSISALGFLLNMPGGSPALTLLVSFRTVLVSWVKLLLYQRDLDESQLAELQWEMCRVERDLLELGCMTSRRTSAARVEQAAGEDGGQQ